MDSFKSKDTIKVSGKELTLWRLGALQDKYPVERLPFAHKILLENLLRCEDGVAVSAADIKAVASWDPKAEPSQEIAFRPSRVLLQDFTGVPAVVDLAAMRAAVQRLGFDPKRINPLQPVELVIDHSVQVDSFGTPEALERNLVLEAERNGERYAFLRWGQSAFANFKVTPPGAGIVHQVNLEYLARVVFTQDVTSENGDGERIAYPDTLVGTDSHTTMINGLGVLGWGVGGIEAEAAMLGQPVSMLIPQVVGFKLSGALKEGVTATDLVLTVTQMLREKGVVGKFVEFYGAGLDHLPLADRATIANMAPEYGATCGIFPVDAETLKYLELSGRTEEQVALVEAYFREQGMFRESGSPEAIYSDTMELDLDSVEACLAGPKRPQDRINLSQAKAAFLDDLGKEPPREPALQDGSVVIAAITSCTNTSNPAVMLAAGLLARKAHERGLKTAPWVKTSLAPGSKVVTRYLEKAGVLSHLEALGFHVVGYGCTTCIGNSGPLPEAVSQEIKEKDLVVCSVLSGNRNFEGRVHAEVQKNYLASPPLVVAYALAGRLDLDLYKEPLGLDPEGKPVFMREIWPTQAEIQSALAEAIGSDMFRESYATVFDGDERWNRIKTPEGDLFAWDDRSVYIKEPPFFQDMQMTPAEVSDIHDARVLALLGDSITTDHISPAGAFKADAPAGQYLVAHGVDPADFNSYGSRRGNHEVMMRGTFANIRLRNRLAPGTEGGFTTHLPTDRVTSIYEAAMEYRKEGTPLIVLAGKEYGSGSSRDWAAKGTQLLGVKAVLAQSYERIHRSNLIGMGVLPLAFMEGDSAESLGLTGKEVFRIEGVRSFDTVTVSVGPDKTFKARVCIYTPQEQAYYRHGGILLYVLRKMLGND